MANTYIFDMPSIIATKRDGAELSPAAIDWLIGQYTSGDIGEEQVAALLMAIYLRGMNGAETAAWTAAILASGERLDLSGLSRPTVDKHSTGGVGDKISLPLVAVVAACGAAVPQLSGRGSDTPAALSTSSNPLRVSVSISPMTRYVSSFPTWGR